ncbi:MAG: aspartate aminotransferase family protein [Pseudomonadota bacterium]
MQPHVMNVYGVPSPVIQRGQGMHLYDDQGEAWLDFHAGIGVNALGAAHPHLVDALQRQSALLWHCSNLHMIPGQERLAARLCALSFADQVFFCNSGVEALEGMIKMARRFHAIKGDSRRWRIMTVTGAFHGRSLATLAAGKNPKHLAGFGPQVDGFDQCPLANMNALRQMITDETAALLVEPIQGESGVHVLDRDYLQALRQTADEFGLLLLFDEVQCGNGRTGRYFAHQWAGIEPDLLATAKGLGGGFPIGAILARQTIADAMHVGSHGSTFGGNPLAMAVSNAVLDIVADREFLSRIVLMGTRLESGLDQLVAHWPAIYCSRRGQGLMQGLVCNKPSNLDMIKALRDHRILVAPAGGNVIRLLPPLIVEDTHIDQVLHALDEIARCLEGNGSS